MSDRMAVFEQSWAAERPRRRWDVRRLRRIGSDWDVMGIGALVLAWFVLVAWTAAGSESWQARVCADLADQPRSCEIVRSRKDENRIAPVTPAMQAAS